MPARCQAYTRATWQPSRSHNVQYKSLRAAHAVKIFLGRIAVLRTQMRPIVTDRVAWSVGSVQFSDF